MRFLVALFLPLLAADYSWPVRVRDRSQERYRVSTAAVAPPLFEFAPLNGAGMTTACACTNPTGSKGEALTFTRASSGTCLKGNTTSSIANGDLVTCSTDQPRVMPGGDGTGVNGLLMERSRTNNALRSEALDNAAWLTESVGTTITVTADQAVAPDGNTTAERIQFGAVTAAQNSGVYQQPTVLGASTGSVFAKGVSGSGSIDVSVYNGTVWTCGTCSFASTSWTRCSVSAATNGTYIEFGNLGAKCGGSRTAQDVYLWGAQFEAGAYVTSYIATAGATVTRAVELATLPLSGMGTTQGSAMSTVIPIGSIQNDTSDHASIALSVAGPTYQAIPLDFRPSISAGYYSLYISGPGSGNSDRTGSCSMSSGTAVRLGGDWSTTAANIWACGTATAIGSGASMTSAPTLVEIGTFSASATSVFDGVIKQVCIDPSPSKCR